MQAESVISHPFVVRDIESEQFESKAFSENWRLHLRREIEAAGHAAPGPARKRLKRAEEAAQIKIEATRAGRECFDAVRRCVTMEAIICGIEAVCAGFDVDMPEAASGKPSEIINKALDENWWRRQLRKKAARDAEHAAIRAGVVGKGKQPYISDESCIRQALRNRDNRRILTAARVENENGQQYSVAELADKGTANKANRRNELMVRIRGMEEVADTLNHAALFWTVTCPSKFHSVGGTNPKYDGASPRDAQRYMVGQWAKVRAQLDREGIRPYGFRVVEPHTDGCPHWHMLYFVERKNVQRMAQIVHHYAMEMDGDEPGAAENRVKMVTISKSNGGSAAGYIAKYISKNIDGHEVGEHKAFEHGEEFTVGAAQFDGIGTITPSMRVTYWSQVWGIRQFQQIGAVPVGIWREFRRIEEDKIADAPDYIKTAWAAVQTEKDAEGNTIKQADFGAFIQALGGPHTGRNTTVKLQKMDVEISGRYASYWDKKPVGVYAWDDMFKTYESTRYVWRTVCGEGPAVHGPRTGVNNCTDVDSGRLGLDMWLCTKERAEQVKKQKIVAPQWVDYREIRERAKKIEKETQQFVKRRGKHDDR